MKSYKNWDILSKLMIPLVATGIAGGLAIILVSALIFRDLRGHTIPELLAVNSLRSAILDLIGEYREYANSPTLGVMDEINTLKAEIEGQMTALERDLLTKGHPFGREVEDNPIHDVSTIEALRAGLRKLLMVGDRMVENRRNVVQALVALEDSELEITETIKEALEVVEGEVRESAERNAWRSVVEASLPELSALGSLSGSGHAFLSETREYVLDPSDHALAQLNAIEGDLSRYVADFARTAKEHPEERSYIGKLQSEIQRLVSHSKSAVRLGNRVTDSLADLEDISESFQKDLRDLTTSSAKGTDVAARRGLIIIAGTVLIMLSLTLVLIFWISKGIADPVWRLHQVASKFGSGDLAIRANVKRRDEVGQLAEAFNAMANNLSATVTALGDAKEELIRKERLATVGQIAATVSHELRNPLGAMRTSIAAIKKLAPQDEPLLQSSVAIVDRSITRCDNIIDDLLDYSRIRPLKCETTAVDGWLADLLDEYQHPEGIVLHRELASGADVAIDRDRMWRALINVLDNAWQAMTGSGIEAEQGGPGRLTVTARRESGQLLIQVTDTGPGIPVQDLDQVFEPLYSTKNFGVGLGLPMVKQIMEQHGGGVRINSEAGQGSEVVLWLPLEASGSSAAKGSC